MVTMPMGLSHEALLELLRLRYGQKMNPEYILEARHYAELFDWTCVREMCDTKLFELVENASTIDADSLAVLVSHTEESLTTSEHLKFATVSAVLRQWTKVAESVATALPAGRCEELKSLSRIRARDGHISTNLEEYLHAMVDDLMEWERSLKPDTQVKVRKRLEDAWHNWHQLLLDYGRIFGASAAQSWRERVLLQRKAINEDQTQASLGHPYLPAGRVWFVPTGDWREVPSNAICPCGLEYRFDMETGKNFARLCS